MNQQHNTVDIQNIASNYALKSALFASRPMAIVLGIIVLVFSLSQSGIAAIILAVVGLIWFIEPFFIRVKPWYIDLNIATSIIPGIIFIIIAIFDTGLRNTTSTLLVIGIGVFSLIVGFSTLAQRTRLIAMTNYVPSEKQIREITELRESIWSDPGSFVFTLQSMGFKTIAKARIHENIIVVVGSKPGRIWMYKPDEIEITPSGDINQPVIKAVFRFNIQKAKGILSQENFRKFQEWKREGNE